jgi:hypothetical protein
MKPIHKKIIITFLILILICYVIYKLDINIIDTIFFSNDELVKDKLTYKINNLDLNNSIALSEKLVIVEKSIESANTLIKVIVKVKYAIVPIVNKILIATVMGSISAIFVTALNKKLKLNTKKCVPMRPIAKLSSLIITSLTGGVDYVESLISNKISNSIKSEYFLIPSPNETISTAKNNLYMYNFIENHPVDALLYSILVLNYVSLFLILSLSISLLYKFFSKSTLELNIIDKIIPENYSTKIKYYINK